MWQSGRLLQLDIDMTTFFLRAHRAEHSYLTALHYL
jgi:hypothetical protein